MDAGFEDRLYSALLREERIPKHPSYANLDGRLAELLERDGKDYVGRQDVRSHEHAKSVARRAYSPTAQISWPGAQGSLALNNNQIKEARDASAVFWSEDNFFPPPEPNKCSPVDGMDHPAEPANKRDNIDGACGSDTDPYAVLDTIEDHEERKKTKRQIRNRLSAKRARERCKSRMEELEKINRDLKDENLRLTWKVFQLREQLVIHKYHSLHFENKMEAHGKGHV